MIFAFSFPGILVWAAIQQISMDTPRLRRILTSGKEKSGTAYRVLKSIYLLSSQGVREGKGGRGKERGRER
jgi:hypothetical protein